MKGYTFAIATALLLSGCGGKDKLYEGYYLFEDVHVEFDNSNAFR